MGHHLNVAWWAVPCPRPGSEPWAATAERANLTTQPWSQPRYYTFNSHTYFKELKMGKKLFFIFTQLLTISVLPSFLKIQSPYGIISLQPEEIPLAFLAEQVSWQWNLLVSFIWEHLFVCLFVFCFYSWRLICWIKNYGLTGPFFQQLKELFSCLLTSMVSDEQLVGFQIMVYVTASLFPCCFQIFSLCLVFSNLIMMYLGKIFFDFYPVASFISSSRMFFLIQHFQHSKMLLLSSKALIFYIVSQVHEI